MLVGPCLLALIGVGQLTADSCSFIERMSCLLLLRMGPISSVGVPDTGGCFEPAIRSRD